MLNECISIFEKHAEYDVDKMVLDNYSPAEGFYLILEETPEGFKEKEYFEIKQDKKTKKLNLSDAKLRTISEMDYYCKLIDMNKPVDSKKIIQSNNYLCFCIKKESLTNGKLTEEIIDNYYEVLSDPYIKYSKNKQDKELYQLAEKEAGPINQEKLQIIKRWIKENIFRLPYELTGKDYLKIFFQCADVSMKKEGERYLLPNLFNKNDYNIKVNGIIYGLPNENMGLNSKKPYLENKNRKYTVPVLTSTEKNMVRKKFFDYLWGQASKGFYNIYFDSDKNEVVPLGSKDSPKESLRGYYLRIRKDKNEAAILDMDCISAYRPKLAKPFLFDNILDIETEKLDGHNYGKNYNLINIRDIINEEIFSKFLLSNFYNEPGEISCNNDEVLKENILLSRNALFNWFYKGYENGIDELMEKISVNLIKNSISNGHMEKVQHQFNAYISIIEYLKGGNERMADVMKEIRDSIREKINQKEYVSLQTDEEYYYATGQLIRYFISLNKSNKKMHSLFNPFLTIKKDELLKEKLEVLFKKYNYSIEADSLRFNNIYSMVTNYVPESADNSKYLIAGYISKSLIYEKKEDSKNE